MLKLHPTERGGPTRAPSGRTIALAVCLLLALAGAWLGLRLAAGPPAPPAAAAGGFPDLTDLDRTLRDQDLVFTVGLGRPVRPLEPFELRLRLEEPDGRPVPGLEPRASFFMEMDMGPQIHRLEPVPAEPGLYRAEVMLPGCSLGGKRWYLDLQVRRGAATRAVTLQLDMP